MEHNLNKDKISKLVILLLLAAVLPITAALVGQRQEIRKEAAGSGVVKLTLDPSSGSKARGQAFTVINVKMTATQAKQIYAGEVKLQFQSTVFDISNVACGSNFPMKVQGNVSGNNINLICSREGGAAAFTFAANTPVILGSFRATVKNNAPLGASQISFVSAKIPEATTLIDLSDAGTTATYTITGGTGPTNTPRPPSPTPTGGAGPTPTPTPTGGATRMVSLVVKLRGIDQPPAIAANQLLNFKITFVRAGAAPSFFEPQGLAPVTGGNWTIVVPANTLPAGQYEVYIKGPKHLQKKFPKVVLDGSASQTIDLTTLGARYYLDPGDLPIGGPNHDQQDGVVNSLDAVYLIGCFATPDEATCLAKADLNLDGIISTMDIELLNGTVYSKWEDEVE